MPLAHVVGKAVPGFACAPGCRPPCSTQTSGPPSLGRALAPAGSVPPPWPSQSPVNQFALGNGKTSLASYRIRHRRTPSRGVLRHVRQHLDCLQSFDKLRRVVALVRTDGHDRSRVGRHAGHRRSSSWPLRIRHSHRPASLAHCRSVHAGCRSRCARSNAVRWPCCPCDTGVHRDRSWRRACHCCGTVSKIVAITHHLSSSLRLKFLCSGQVWINVPSTLKCSPDSQLPPSASSNYLVEQRNHRIMGDQPIAVLAECRRGTHTASSIDNPMNQRNNRLY